MRFPRTAREWLPTTLIGGVAAPVIFALNVGIGLNLESFMQARHLDRLWAQVDWTALVAPLNHWIVWLALIAASSAGGLLILQIDRFLRKAEPEPTAPAAAKTPGAEQPSLLGLQEGGTWIYEHASPRVRDHMRSVAPGLGLMINSYGGSLIRDAATAGVCPLSIRWEEGLPWEEAWPVGPGPNPFDAQYGMDRKTPGAGQGVSPKHLPAILQSIEARFGEANGS